MPILWEEYRELPLGDVERHAVWTPRVERRILFRVERHRDDRQQRQRRPVHHFPALQHVLDVDVLPMRLEDTLLDRLGRVALYECEDVIAVDLVTAQRRGRADRLQEGKALGKARGKSGVGTPLGERV